MSIANQALDIVEAYNPMWTSILGETILARLPEEERQSVLEILYTMRVHEIERTLRYAKTLGNPRRKARFLAETKEASRNFCMMMEMKD